MIAICFTRLIPRHGETSELLALVLDMVKAANKASKKEPAVMIPLDPIQPNNGYTLLCRKCTNWSEKGFDMGHPHPCKRVRWAKTTMGDKHYKPKIKRDLDGTVTCPDFNPNPQAQSNVPRTP